MPRCTQRADSAGRCSQYAARNDSTSWSRTRSNLATRAALGTGARRMSAITPAGTRPSCTCAWEASISTRVQVSYRAWSVHSCAISGSAYREIMSYAPIARFPKGSATSEVLEVLALLPLGDAGLGRLLLGAPGLEPGEFALLELGQAG